MLINLKDFLKSKNPRMNAEQLESELKSYLASGWTLQIKIK